MFIKRQSVQTGPFPTDSQTKNQFLDDSRISLYGPIQLFSFHPNPNTPSGHCTVHPFPFPFPFPFQSLTLLIALRLPFLLLSTKPVINMAAAAAAATGAAASGFLSLYTPQRLSLPSTSSQSFQTHFLLKSISSRGFSFSVGKSKSPVVIKSSRRFPFVFKPAQSSQDSASEVLSPLSYTRKFM